MKKLITIFILCVSIRLFAQAPQSINYQAIAWNNDNTPRANQLIRVKISILNQSAGGSEVFSEEYQVTTNSQGLFTLEIGSLNLNDFQKINWASGAKFLQVSINGILIGTTKMLSVPYALYAESTNLKAGVGIGVNGNTITNAGDLDNTNEIQALSITGNQLSLSKNGGTVLIPSSSGSGTTYSAGSGISISPTNIISADLKAGEGIAITGNSISSTTGSQTLSINANELTISDGNTVTLPSASALEIYIFEERRPHGLNLTAKAGWNKRELTYTVTEHSNKSVESNGSSIKFNQTGKYLITASAPSFRSNRNRLVLRRDDGSEKIDIFGTSDYNDYELDPNQTSRAVSRSFILGVLTISTPNILYRLDHYIETNADKQVLGLAANLPSPNNTAQDFETYAQIMIQKIQ